MRKKLYTALLICFVLCAGCDKKEAALYDSASVAAEEGTDADASTESEVSGASEDGSVSSEAYICVYVCGEVQSSGVYYLPEGSRIADAVDAAGGMTDDAADTYLNLAELVSDGQKIEVPSQDEAEALEEAEAEAQSSLININTATEQELMTLTGIGESKAAEIVAYREAHGDFSSIEDIMNIPGIKEGVYSKIRDYITV